MLALHTVWYSGQALAVWAEVPKFIGARASDRLHPFAASPDDLRSLVRAGAALELDLYLPSRGRSPVPSPAAGPQPASKPKLARWRVPTLALTPAEAVSTLPVLAAQPSAGDSVRYLMRAFELCVEMVAAGRVVPQIFDDDGGLAARWVPLPGPGDLSRLAALARAMPPILRAEAVDGPKGRSSQEILDEFVGSMLDAVVRKSVGMRGRRGPLGRALLSSDRYLPSDDPAAAKLAQSLAEWRPNADDPVRTCFRLVPPDDGADDESWHIEFLLQSAEDPSLIVPAEEVWRSGDRLSVVMRSIAAPQEALLAGLGRASALYPALEAALEVPRPSEMQLDTSEAAQFLAEVAPPMEQAGFGVLVPSSLKSRARAVGLRVRASPKTDGVSHGLLGADAICEYRYEAVLGDEAVDLSELEEVARIKSSLVRLRGRWVVLSPEDVRAALRALQRGSFEAPASQVLKSALGLTGDAEGLPVVGISGDGWLGEFLGAGDRKLKMTPAPNGFRGTLRPYQRRGLAWLRFLDSISVGGCLADDMGLGKTIQLLALLLSEREDGASAAPTLLVCPMSVVGNWQRESERFAPSLEVIVHHGSGRSISCERFAKQVAGADLVITTYALAARDQAVLSATTWGRVVLDEAQNVKNAHTKQARAVRSIPAPRRVAMTGTPVENRLAELWSIIDFLNPGLLGGAEGFRRAFAVPIERFGDEEAAATLRRVTSPFILRRLKTDRRVIKDLPEKNEMKVFCNLTREQATLYKAVVDEMLERIEQSDGIERKGLVLATLTRLKQVCNHPAHYLADNSGLKGRSGKLERTAELVEEALAEGDRVLVFTQFAEMGSLLHEHLARETAREIPFLHGGVPRARRDEMVGWFQSDEGPPAMVLSLKAGGVGLNLTRANHVIHFDRWWNPAVEDQATDRAFRIGQVKNVQVRKLICVGTLDERIDQMIERKRDLAERIVGTGEAWVSELSTEEIRQLVQLSADAVAEG